MPPDERRQPREVGLLDRPALSLELGQHFLHVDRIPVNDDVEQHAQRTEFFLLPLAQGAADFTAFTQEDAPAEAMAQFLTIQLREDATPEHRIVDVAQDVERLDDAAELGQGTREGRRIVLHLQGAHDAGGLQVPEFQRSGKPNQVGPIRPRRTNAAESLVSMVRYRIDFRVNGVTLVASRIGGPVGAPNSLQITERRQLQQESSTFDVSEFYTLGRGENLQTIDSQG